MILTVGRRWLLGRCWGWGVGGGWGLSILYVVGTRNIRYNVIKKT